MYLRSPRFAACLQTLLDAGASIDDPLLKAVLLDDDSAVQKLVNTGLDLNRKLRISNAFTSCEGVTALHICAEFNCVKCARVLLEAGADVNATANIDTDMVSAGKHRSFTPSTASLTTVARRWSYWSMRAPT